jgi:hypothetical protein
VRAIGNDRPVQRERGEIARMIERIDLRRRRCALERRAALHIDLRAHAGQRIAGQAPVADALDVEHARRARQDRSHRRIEIALVQLRELVERIAETQCPLVAFALVMLPRLAQRDVADEGAEAQCVAGRDRPHRELDRKFGAQAVRRRQLNRPVQDVRLPRGKVARHALLVQLAITERHDELRQQLSARLVARPAESPLGLRVPLVDAARSIDDDHRLGRRGDRRGEPLAALAQCALGHLVPRDLLAQQAR